MPERKLRVFLCHASQDKPVVRELYQRLLAEGWIDPWLDEEKLLPGQDWDMEIDEAVESADAVIVCLSRNSVSREGYIQKEIRKILAVAEEKIEGTIFVIPLRLEECEVPRRLSQWQWVDVGNADWFSQLLFALENKSDNKNIAHFRRIVKTLFMKLEMRDDITEFSAALQILEALQSEAKLPLDVPILQKLIDARKWWDEKRKMDGGRMSIAAKRDLEDIYKEYKGILNNRESDRQNSEYGLDDVNSVKAQYLYASKSFIEIILSRVNTIADQSPIIAQMLLQSALRKPISDDDKRIVRNYINEIRKKNEELENLVLKFVSDELSDEEKIVVGLFVNDRTIEDISLDMNLSSYIVEMLINSACEKLRQYFKLDWANPTTLVNYLLPYWLYNG